MGYQLIKPVREEDFYVLWSSIIDGPVAWGTREEMFAYLDTPRRGEVWATRIETTRDLDLADVWGSTGSDTYDPKPGIMRFGGHHNVKRKDLKALCAVIARHPDWNRRVGWQDFQDDPEAACLLTDIRDT